MFVGQTRAAALLFPDPQKLITDGDPGGTASYDAAAVAGGVAVAGVGQRHSRDWRRHLVLPVIGFAILAYVVANVQVAVVDPSGSSGWWSVSWPWPCCWSGAGDRILRCPRTRDRRPSTGSVRALHAAAAPG